MKYRKKPVVIEAIQIRADNEDELMTFLDGAGHTCVKGAGRRVLSVVIDTLEGVMIGNPGDWIIKGVRGEFYPCKPDIFDETYEPVGDES